MTINTYAERDLVRVVVMRSDDGGITWFANEGEGTDVASRPAGEITMYGSAAPPAGWLLCDGASHVRTEHADLFDVIGTTFGAADATHFNVPDMRDKFAKGANGDIGTTVAAATHTHAVGSIAAGSHTHGTGGVTVDSHTHVAGTLVIPSHSHDKGTLASQSHYHLFDGTEAGDGTTYGFADFNNNASGHATQRRISHSFTPTHYGGDNFHSLNTYTTAQANATGLSGNTYWGHYADGTVSTGGTVALGSGVTGVTPSATAVSGSTGTASVSTVTGDTSGTTPSMSGTSAATTAPNPVNLALTYIIKD